MLERKLAIIIGSLFALLVLPAAAACAGGDGAKGDQPETTPSPTAETTPRAEPSSSANITPPALTPGSGEGPEPSGTIAFISFRDGDREIYSMDADGSGLKNLTNNPANDDNPDWSPDGRKIAFVSDRDGGVEIYVMNADGSEQTRLTTEMRGDMSPRWSPDGSKIAISRSGTIVVMDADGGNQRVVMQAEAEDAAAPCKAGGFPGGWSPDGTKITYYSASISRGIAQVCTIGVDGSGLTVVVSDPPAFHVEPAWSPDGRFIAFRSIRGENHDVYVVDLETGKERRLTDDPAMDIEPMWSPDGEWIVFPSSRDNEFFDIYIMRKDGSDLRVLTTDPAKDSEPVWTR